MVDKELIEIWRNMLKPSISSRLLKTNYEGKGEQDKEEFEHDFDEILDLALIGLKHKAQLSQERTKKRTKTHAETHARDLISRQAAIEVINHELRCGAVTDQCGLETAHDLIEKLPTAQLDVPDTNVGDLISRQAAIDAAELAYVRGMFPTPFIREVPPAQPEERTEKHTETHACD